MDSENSNVRVSTKPGQLQFRPYRVPPFGAAAEAISVPGATDAISNNLSLPISGNGSSQRPSSARQSNVLSAMIGRSKKPTTPGNGGAGAGSCTGSRLANPFNRSTFGELLDPHRQLRAGGVTHTEEGDHAMNHPYDGGYGEEPFAPWLRTIPKRMSTPPASSGSNGTDLPPRAPGWLRASAGYRPGSGPA